MANTQPDITRTVAIEHAGEKIHIEVHIHLSQEERRQLAQVVIAEISKRVRAHGPVLIDNGIRGLPQATLDEDS